jgi:hypothetical protein
MIFPFIISLTGLALLLINSILFIGNRKDKGRIYQYITIYLSLQFLVELLCNIIGILNPNSNFFLSHYYFVIQFILLSLFYRELLKNTILKKIVSFNLVIILLILSFQYYQTSSLYWKFNYFEIESTSIILILYSIIYFYENLKGTYRYFYFCLGLTFYLTSSCLIFLSGNTELVFFKEPFYFDIWIFNSLFFIMYQIFIYKEWKYLIKNES